MAAGVLAGPGSAVSGQMLLRLPVGVERACQGRVPWGARADRRAGRSGRGAGAAVRRTAPWLGCSRGQAQGDARGS